MDTLLLSLLFSTTLVYNSQALLIPDLSDIVPKLKGSQLDFKVAFGGKENPFQINGVCVKLDGNRRQQSKNKVSSGIFDAILIDTKPYFITEKGLKEAPLENGGWELRWPQKSPYGILVCSFMVPTDLKRNEDTTLERGRFFMHHRIWSEETLESERERRRAIQSEASIALKERDEQVEKLVDEEESAFNKVVSYGKAAKSMSNFRSSGLEEARFTPLFDDQVLELVPRACILSTRGLIYKARSEKKREMEIAGQSRVDWLKDVR